MPVVFSGALNFFFVMMSSRQVWVDTVRSEVGGIPPTTCSGEAASYDGTANVGKLVQRMDVHRPSPLDGLRERPRMMAERLQPPSCVRPDRQAHHAPARRLVRLQGFRPRRHLRP